MGSLLGMALRGRPRNAAPPVPMGGSGFLGISGLSLQQSGYLSYMNSFASNGTVWQIAHLLASSVAKPEWRLYRKTKTDGRVRYTTNDQGSDQRQEVVQHQALSVLQRPASIKAGSLTLPVWTRFGLFEFSQLHLELTGEAYWVVDRDPRSSVPLGLWPVRPDRMEPVPDPQQYLKGWVYTSPDGREKVPLQVDEVIQVKYPNPMDPYRGLGPAQAVLADIEAARYSAEWNRNFFLNSAEPGGIIQVDHPMDDDEWNDLSDRWREAHRGVARAHRVAVLEAGQTWVPNPHSLKDMDFSNLRNVSRDLIREAWGIHKIMLGNSDDVNRANAQTGEEVFANWSVAPRLDRWKDALNHQLLPLFGSTGEGVEFDYIYPTPQNREQDMDELVAKAAAVQTLVAAGYDAAAVLEMAGLPDMPWSAPAAAVPPKPTDKDQINGGKFAGYALPAVTAGPDTAAKVFAQQAEDYPPHAMAWMHHATWKGPVKVPLDHVQPDMKWMDGASPDHVQDFVKRRQKGKKLKPVILVKTPGSAKLQLIDGHHRYLAEAELGEPVRAYIGTVDADHGGWETMHDFQFDHGKGGKNVVTWRPLLRQVLSDGYVPIDSVRR